MVRQKSGSQKSLERLLITLAASILVSMTAMAPAAGQQAATQATAVKPVMVEDVFKNVQELKGIPVNQFMDTMGFFAAALGLNCTGCHVPEALQDWSRFADDIPRKRMSRIMIRMVDSINKEKFGGRRMITCWSCHRGGQAVENIPSLMVQYSVAPEDPNAIEMVQDAPKEPTANQILDKYIQAAGGAQRLAELTSWAAKGTYDGYNTYHVKVPVEIFAKAPAQRALFAHTQIADNAEVFDGANGWVAGLDRPLPLLALLPGPELDGAKLDAMLGFPGSIRQALTDWKTGFPPTTIDDKLANIVQGTGAGKTRVKLYFDDKTGLLMRQVRYTDTPIGMVPTQIDYSDYRDVAGVRLPYHIVVTWTDGQTDILLSDIQANVPIDAAKFGKPAPAVAKKQGK
ncbi:MAG TPA: photosynthetic reaction center cytochrome c subunit family protein [Chthoniobacterales bacterium]|jgi:photosynthetic reaction center cytochrome c subunit|nr:photosynthetic reaction center cytochrome c subunit family protein [Chthoniobacterales bacterium]